MGWDRWGKEVRRSCGEGGCVMQSHCHVEPTGAFPVLFKGPACSLVRFMCFCVRRNSAVLR